MVDEPFEVFYDDFDDNGKKDIVLAYYNYGIQFPLRGFSCSSQQVPDLQDKFKKYDIFASLDVQQVYGEENLENALRLSVNTFESAALINNKSFFDFRPLPNYAQFSSVNDIIIKDFDNDKFTYESNDEIIELKGRPTALRRSLENVIQNGLTYGDKVNVKVQKGNKKASILIEDDGPGIPENQFKNVFKPFFRLDKSRSLNQSGVGLGLAIVEDTINAHGGNIQLGTSQLGGLLVKISLPL